MDNRKKNKKGALNRAGRAAIIEDKLKDVTSDEDERLKTPAEAPVQVKRAKVVSNSDSEDDSDEDEDVSLFKSNSRPSVVTATSAAKPKQNVSSGMQRNNLSRALASSFNALQLDEWICDNLTKVSITKPTAVQVACIPPILAGCKVLSASAPTGSGKTAAFALPILDKLARDPYGVFALVLTPTRELAIQIGEQFTTLGAPINCRCEVIIGGLPMVAQQLALAKSPHIVVATPGRLATHVIGADPPKLGKVMFLVLDESDRLLTPGEGFGNDLVRISNVLPVAKGKSMQTLLFSATSGGQKDVATAHKLGLCISPETEFQWDYAIAAKEEESSERSTNLTAPVKLVPSTLTQTMSLIPNQAKHAYLAWFMKTFAPKPLVSSSKLAAVTLSKKEKPDQYDRAKSMIVFTSTCEQCQLYHEMLGQLSVPSVAIHGELPQKKRQDNLIKFRSGAVPILVATDVASRGLDIPQVDVVLNLDVPRESENYVHRIGRCARAGREGRSFLFVTQIEVDLVKAIEKFTSKRLDVFDIDDDAITVVLHKASAAKRKAMMKLHDDGFLDKIKIRKQRRSGKSSARSQEDE